MAAGFMAGITEALLIVTPFEVVKIRLQQQKGCAKTGLKYKVREGAGGRGLGAGVGGRLRGRTGRGVGGWEGALEA
jgi:hypothetical protein